MPETKLCPKCNATMEPGFTVDQGYGTWRVGAWYAGPPEKGFFGNAKVWKKRSIELSAYRCIKCGFVEWYAI